MSAARIAYYYPEPAWISGDWIKSLMLFFDGIALLMPRIYEQPFREAEDWLVEPLLDRGILHLLRPEVVVDEVVGGRLATLVTAMLEAGAFPCHRRSRFSHLEELGREAFQGISSTRLGPRDFPITVDLIRRLGDAGLLLPGSDQALRGRKGEREIKLDSVVRASILNLLPLLIRQRVAEQGGPELIPVTDDYSTGVARIEALKLQPFPALGKLVSLDLTAAGVNTSNVPLDEILAYRVENGELYRTYLHNLEKTAIELSHCQHDEQEELLRIRTEEIEDALDDLRRAARAWRRPMAGMSIGLAGASWAAIHTHSLVGPALAALGALIGFSLPDQPVTHFSYLFRMSDYQAPVTAHLSGDR